MTCSLNENFMTNEVTSSLKKIFSYIDNNKERYIQNLKEVVAIPSVSCFPEQRNDVINMMKWYSKKLEDLGGKADLCDIGRQNLHNGQTLELPPVILGSLGVDKNKPTVFVYGHLDVQPADKEDGWDTDPFELTLIDGKLYGRGSTDDKGPAISWLHVIEAYQNCKVELPVNLKFCLEGMEESGSIGLDMLLNSKKDTFLNDVDFVCISDNYWLGTKKPCLTYGLRGNAYFFIEVSCAKKDLHSGSYGGSVHEAMSDLIYLLDKLVDKDGKILIPGIMDDVTPLSKEEANTYSEIDFCMDEYKNDVGTSKLIQDTNDNVLMSRWRYPSLSIHGIEGAYSDYGAKTVIPSKVIGKFSIRLVPNQDPNKIGARVCDYITKLWEIRNSPNKFSVHLHRGSFPWVGSPFDFNYSAARKAVWSVYNVEPDLTREGGSIPITLTLEKLTNKSVLLLPMGASDDGPHSQNEKIDVKNYIEGTKLFAAYLHELGKYKT